MGIKFGDLFDDIREPLKLKDLKNKRVGIDAYIVIYQMLARIRTDEGAGEGLTDSQGRITSHLQGLFTRTLALIDEGVNVVYVFDGPPPDFKTAELRRRTERKKKAEEEYQRAIEEEDLERAKKFSQQTITIDEQIINDSKRLLDLLGVSYLTAKHDAEAQLAMMAQKGYIDAVASQDYDTFLFGAPLVVRNLTISKTRMIRGQIRTVVPEKISLEKALSTLEISREQLIHMGLLIGTDFNDKIPKIGSKTAEKLVKEHKDWNSLIQHVSSNYLKEDQTINDYFSSASPKTIIDYFLNPPYNEDFSLDFSARADIKGIIEFLVKERDFNEERVTKQLSGLAKKQKQTSLKSFLS
ncbi:MAG: flap endonuclease-1 [Candidatus Thorarchaeota archaeon]